MFALIGAGCDKVPLLAPTQSTITASADAKILPLGGSTVVSAVVLEQSGTPVQNGTTVRFTTTLGRVTPVESQTVNGIATTTFSAGDISGIASVRATSGAAGGTTTSGTGTNSTTTTTNVIEITIGAAAIDSITIRANPSSVSPTGGTVDVIATVLGANGRTVSGVPVSFSANRGTLTSTTATTDSNGDATVRLTTNVETTINASAGGKTTATAATVTVRATPSVTMTCLGSGATSAGSCAQVTSLPVSFTISRGSSTSAIVSSVLDFGDGSTTSMGSLSSTAVVTHTYSSAANYTATVRATDVNGETTSASVSVSITARLPLAVTITTSAETAVLTQGQRWTFTANVTPTADASSVESYKWDFGDGTDTVTTTGNVTARVYTTNGRKIVTVTVETTDDRTGTGRTEIVTSGI